MNRSFLFAVAATAALSCTPPPAGNVRTSLLPLPAREQCLRLDGVCDIATSHGEVVRTSVHARTTGDTTRIACIDELGVSLVAGFATESGITVERSWPPVSRENARTTLFAAACGLHLCEVKAKPLTPYRTIITARNAQVLTNEEGGPQEVTVKDDDGPTMLLWIRGNHVVLVSEERDTLVSIDIQK